MHYKVEPCNESETKKSKSNKNKINKSLNIILLLQARTQT